MAINNFEVLSIQKIVFENYKDYDSIFSLESKGDLILESKHKTIIIEFKSAGNEGKIDNVTKANIKKAHSQIIENNKYTNVNGDHIILLSRYKYNDENFQIRDWAKFKPFIESSKIIDNGNENIKICTYTHDQRITLTSIEVELKKLIKDFLRINFFQNKDDIDIDYFIQSLSGILKLDAKSTILFNKKTMPIIVNQTFEIDENCHNTINSFLHKNNITLKEGEISEQEFFDYWINEGNSSYEYMEYIREGSSEKNFQDFQLKLFNEFYEMEEKNPNEERKCEVISSIICFITKRKDDK